MARSKQVIEPARAASPVRSIEWDLAVSFSLLRAASRATPHFRRSRNRADHRGSDKEDVLRDSEPAQMALNVGKTDQGECGRYGNCDWQKARC